MESIDAWINPAKELLLIAILLLYPIGVGGVCDCVWNKDKKERTLGGVYLSGCMVYGVVFFALALLGRIRGWQFERVEKLLLLISLLMLAGCVLALVTVKGYRSNIKQLFSSIGKIRMKGNIAWAVAYVAVAAVYFSCPFYISEVFSVPEQVLLLVKTGELQMVNDSLAIFYACLCRWFALPVGSVLFHVIPYIMLLLCFCVISELGDIFFKAGSRAKTIFLVCYVLLILFGNEAHMNPPYMILHYPYEGMTLVSNVLVPSVFVIFFKKKNLLYVPVLIFLAGMSDPLHKGIIVLVFEMLMLEICMAVFALWNVRKQK